jgi:hypothetical protein
MKLIELPEHGYEADLVEFIKRFSDGGTEQQIGLDLKPVKFLTPGALVLILATINRWIKEKKEVSLVNCAACPAFGYLQRIDFFSTCGIKLKEEVARKDAARQFVELRKVAGGVDVAKLSTDIAYCLFPDADSDDPDKSGLFDILQYSVSELTNNVIQHSKSSGFATAQYTGSTDLVRVAIADDGIGVRASFKDAGSPHFSPNLSHSGAIALATQPKVSSKAHMTTAWGESVNAGVGLTLLKAVSLLTGGSFFMASGTGVCTQQVGEKEMSVLELPQAFSGTICALSFQRAKVQNFADLLYKAKEAVGLLQNNKKFDNLFS